MFQFHLNTVGSNSGLTDPLLNNNQGFEVVNRLRSWKRLKANITIQQLFGDISVMHQQKLRREFGFCFHAVDTVRNNPSSYHIQVHLSEILNSRKRSLNKRRKM